MDTHRRWPSLVICLAALLLAQPARAEDPPVYDVLAALHLEPTEDVAELASARHLPCIVRAGSPLETFAAGDAVFLSRLSGAFSVVPDTQGVLACCVGETVHDRELLSPRRALVALGLEPSDEPLKDGDSIRTRVVDPARLAAHGVSCAGVGDEVSVSVTGTGDWWIRSSTHGPSSTKFDPRPHYAPAPRAPVGDALERATVVLDPGTLSEGGRLLAQVVDPARLEPHRVRGMPAGDFVHLTRGSGSAWTLTTLSPGFSRVVTLLGVDAEALGLEGLRLLDLPVGQSVRGRLTYAWKAAQEGLRGVRSRDPVEVVHRPDGRYVLRGSDPRRPGSLVLPDPAAP